MPRTAGRSRSSARASAAWGLTFDTRARLPWAILGAMARILIIDDNETMREGLGATVRRMNHEAVLAASGAEGLAAFGKRGADFVITDLKMEGPSGLDVVKAVRERDPDCPVMIVGAFDFLQKPFAPEVVRLKVTRALELRGEKRARERAEAETAALRADAAQP